MNKKKLIISLIKDHLINTKLINGLNAMGLDADAYSVSLGQTIFELIGFEDKSSDKIFEHYLELTEKVNKINITKYPRQLEDLAKSIYNHLLTKRPK